MAKVEKAYEAVCDFLARDQFLKCCSHKLYLYLKPKLFKILGELAHEMDFFADAWGGVPGCVAKGQRESRREVTHTYENPVDWKPSISCKICGKANQTHNYWHNKNKRVSAGGVITSSAKFHSPNQGGNWQTEAAIGIKVIIITVGTSQLPLGIPIGTIIMRKSTIRSTFVK